jgi:hypothetical protein
MGEGVVPYPEIDTFFDKFFDRFFDRSSDKGL